MFTGMVEGSRLAAICGIAAGAQGDALRCGGCVSAGAADVQQRATVRCPGVDVQGCGGEQQSQHCWGLAHVNR